MGGWGIKLVVESGMTVPLVTIAVHHPCHPAASSDATFSVARDGGGGLERGRVCVETCSLRG